MINILPPELVLNLLRNNSAQHLRISSSSSIIIVVIVMMMGQFSAGSGALLVLSGGP